MVCRQPESQLHLLRIRIAGVKNPKALAKFALSYMTSIGHTYGSAPMGKVVDDKFQVMGVNGLSIVDASILPQLTRLNPAFTVMAIGRYVSKRQLVRTKSSWAGYFEPSACTMVFLMCRYAGELIAGKH